MENLTQEALRNGGDYCDLFFENTTIWSLMLKDSEVTSGGNSAGDPTRAGYKGVEIKGMNDFYPMKEDLRQAPPSGFVPLLRKLDSAIRAADTRVIKVVAGLSYSVSEILMYNSLGELTEDLRPLCSPLRTRIPHP